MRSWFLLAAAMSVAPHAAAVYKCVNDEGDGVIYSDAPCGASNESQPVNASRNSVERDAGDHERMRRQQADALRRARELQVQHGSQHNHAQQVRRAAEAEEAARAARNAQVQSVVPRAATATNPPVQGPAPTWYHR